MTRAGMLTFGQKLKQDREARGITLAAIESATKIPLHHLEALERNDLASLPGGTFNRGYVRAYAQFVGLDAQEILDAYLHEEQVQGHTAPSAEEITRELSRVVAERQDKRRLTAPRWSLVAAAVVVLVAAGWFFLGRGTTDEPASVTPDVTPGGSPDAASSAEATPHEPDLPAVAETTTQAPAKVETEPAPVEAPPPAQPRTVPVEPTPRASTPATEPVTTSPEPEVRAAPTRPPASQQGGSPAAVPAPESRLRIPEAGVGTAVVNRQLVGVSDRFVEGIQVAFWTRVLGGQPGDKIQHVWIHAGREVEMLELNIGGPHWRTYSLKTLRPGSLGSWAVEARDAEGRVLVRREFECVPGGDSP